MFAEPFSIRESFPPVTYEQWRAAVEAELRGQTLAEALGSHGDGGLALEPLYTQDWPPGSAALAAREGAPGAVPYVRGGPPAVAAPSTWTLRQELAHPDLHRAQEALAADLAEGVTSVLLRPDFLARAGRDPQTGSEHESRVPDGLGLYLASDLEFLLDQVEPEAVEVALQPGAAFAPLAALLAACWQQRGWNRTLVRAALGADPLGALALDGELPYSVERALQLAGDLASWASTEFPRARALAVDTGPYHGAGATAEQELALALATGLAYLRAMLAAGLSLDEAARQLEFRLSLDPHCFLSIAKLRAFRQLWWAVVSVCGGTTASLHVHARLGQRALARLDPQLNQVRNTLALVAAGLGGAQSVTSVPFDALQPNPSDQARRIARHAALILEHEGHLLRVLDPAGGSWYVANLTHQLAARAWSFFQEIERRGGMAAVLMSGWVAEQLQAAYQHRAARLEQGRESLVGVTAFVDTDLRLPTAECDVDVTQAVARQSRAFALRQRPSAAIPALASDPGGFEVAVAAAVGGASLGELAAAFGFHQSTTTIQPFPLRRWAEPFEDPHQQGVVT